MRIVALLIVVAIIYILVSRHASTPASKDLKEAIATVDANMPPQTANASATPEPARTDFKRALDRAHAVTDAVRKQQNEGANF